MQKKILIIGGAGYIGSHIALNLTKAGYEVVVLDNLSNGNEKNILKTFEFIKGDFLDTNLLKKILAQNIHAVILTAALKSVPDSMHDVAGYANINIAGVINLLNCMMEYKINKFVFASSAAVYGDTPESKISEKFQCQPINFYGYSKLAIENLLGWYKRIAGINYVTLRFFNVVGYDKEKNLLGLEKKPANVLPIIMEALFKKREKLIITGSDFNTPDGTAQRDYIHVSDIAQANRLALEFIENKNDSVICNLCTGRATSVKELYEKTCSLSGVKIPVEYGPKRPGDPAILYASNDLAKEKLNWTPKESDLDTIINSTLAVYKHNYQ